MDCDSKVMCSVGKALFCLGYGYELLSVLYEWCNVWFGFGEVMMSMGRMLCCAVKLRRIIGKVMFSIGEVM